MPVKNPRLIAAILIFFLVTALIVTPIVLWAVTQPKSTVNTTCSSDTDCNNHGLCVNGACKCDSPWGGPFCSVLGNLKNASLVANQGIACSQVPTPCKTTDDCGVCTQDMEYSCQVISASQNTKGMAGNYCLPTIPTSNCLTGVESTDSIPGFYTWQGWSDVETQAWTCDCEFPNFYPYTKVSSAGGDTYACVKTPEVCQFGNWTYPCLRDPQDPLACLNESCTGPTDKCKDDNQQCLPILPLSEGKYACQLPQPQCDTVNDCPGCGGHPNMTPTEITELCGLTCISGTPHGTCQKTCKLNSDCGSYPCINGICVTSPNTLVGANPFQYGQCDCNSTSCINDSDCAGSCLFGSCVNQRVALSPDGVPVCVKDTCAPGGAFVPLPIPPYTYGYCDCGTDDYTASGNTCVYTANEPPSVYCALGCGHGKCVGPGQCQCNPGWKGNTICTKFSCDNGGCGHGTCIGPNSCACDPGYTTDSVTGSCSKLSCPNGCVNGTCIPSTSGGLPTCQCNTGFTGTDCSKAITATCSLTLAHSSDTTATQGACVSSTGTCTYGDPDVCTGAYFGNANSFNGCIGCSCTQGYKTPAVASLPPLLCNDGTTTAPCSLSTTCKNTPFDLNTCLQNDFYSYNCSNLCGAFTDLQTYDYNTICKDKTAPKKPAFCP